MIGITYLVGGADLVGKVQQFWPCFSEQDAHNVEISFCCCREEGRIPEVVCGEKEEPADSPVKSWLVSE